MAEHQPKTKSSCIRCDTVHGSESHCAFMRPTLEEWNEITRVMAVFGLNATLRGTGEPGTYIEIILTDRRMVAFRNNRKFWTGDIYPSRQAFKFGVKPKPVKTAVAVNFLQDWVYDPETLADAAATAFGR